MPKQFDEMRQKIKAQLLKDGVKEEEAEKRSYAIATKKWKSTHGGKSPTEYVDADGKFIVGENVKVILDANLSAGDILDD